MQRLVIHPQQHLTKPPLPLPTKPTNPTKPPPILPIPTRRTCRRRSSVCSTVVQGLHPLPLQAWFPQSQATVPPLEYQPPPWPHTPVPHPQATGPLQAACQEEPEAASTSTILVCRKPWIHSPRLRTRRALGTVRGWDRPKRRTPKRTLLTTTPPDSLKW